MNETVPDSESVSPLGKQLAFFCRGFEQTKLRCFVHVSSPESFRLLEEDQEEEAWKVWTWRIPGADWWVLRKPKMNCCFLFCESIIKIWKASLKGSEIAWFLSFFFSITMFGCAFAHLDSGFGVYRSVRRCFQRWHQLSQKSTWNPQNHSASNQAWFCFWHWHVKDVFQYSRYLEMFQSEKRANHANQNLCQVKPEPWLLCPLAQSWHCNMTGSYERLKIW